MFLYFLMFQQEGSETVLGGGNQQLLTLGVGLLFTALAAAYVTRLAKVTLILCYYTMLVRTEPCVFRYVHILEPYFIYLCHERSVLYDLYFMVVTSSSSMQDAVKDIE